MQALLKALEDLKTELSDARMKKFDKHDMESKEPTSLEDMSESPSEEEGDNEMDDISEMADAEGEPVDEEKSELRDFLLGKKPEKEKRPGTAMMIAMEASKSPFKGKTSSPSKRK